MTSQFSCHLANRSIVAVGGMNRRDFLQGLISNDVGLCNQGRAIYAALLTPQGKFLHDFFIIEAGEELFIDCEAARAEDLLKRLMAYKLRAKVTLRDAAAEFEVWAEGNTSVSFRQKPEPIDQFGQSLPGESMCPGLRRGDAYIFADPRLPELGLRITIKKGTARAEQSDFSVYDCHRLALGAVDGSRDMIVEKSTLTDGNFDLLNGISWTKGCYVGQELTARMHYRALVKKRMFPVKIEGAAPACGSMIKFYEEDIGDMRSSSGHAGLALLNIEKAEACIKENAALICGGSKLVPWKPGWMTDQK